MNLWFLGCSYLTLLFQIVRYFDLFLLRFLRYQWVTLPLLWFGAYVLVKMSCTRASSMNRWWNWLLMTLDTGNFASPFSVNSLQRLWSRSHRLLFIYIHFNRFHFIDYWHIHLLDELWILISLLDLCLSFGFQFFLLYTSIAFFFLVCTYVLRWIIRSLLVFFHLQPASLYYHFSFHPLILIRFFNPFAMIINFFKIQGCIHLPSAWNFGLTSF